MQSPVLTFIVPAYNVASTLGDTLHSLRAQERADWSAVVVDDGSLDETPQVSAEFSLDPRFTIVHQENRGLAGARNRGMAESLEVARTSGRRPAEFLCFMDADDTIQPQFIQKMLAALGDTYDLVACWYRMAGPKLEDLDWVIRTGDHDMAPARLIEYNPYAPGAILIRRSAIERALIQTPHGRGLFSKSYSGHEDWDAWLRLGAAAPKGAGAKWAPVVREPLVSYRQRTGSMSAQLERMWRSGIELIGGAPVDDDLKPGAIRRWSIRYIARAAARGNAELATACRAGVEPLSDDEMAFLAGCLRWSLCQQEHIGPGQVGSTHEAAWRQRVSWVLGELAAGVLPHLSFEASSSDAWDETANHLRTCVQEGEMLVIYGIGRNGRDLLSALERIGWRGGLAWIDDDPAAQAPMWGGTTLPRLDRDQLSPQHMVVVTPDESTRIVEALRERGIERVQVGPRIGEERVLV